MKLVENEKVIVHGVEKNTHTIPKISLLAQNDHVFGIPFDLLVRKVVC